MKLDDMRQELALLIKEFGPTPLGFFWVLHDSNNENLDFTKQNQKWQHVKEESWHSLNLGNHQLWATSDNGDLLWWNGEQVIAMRPRDFQFISKAMTPSQFMRLATTGHLGSFFPEDLGSRKP